MTALIHVERNYLGSRHGSAPGAATSLLTGAAP